MNPDTTTGRRIILVDDEVRILLSFSVALKSAGYTDVITFDDSRNVLPFLENNPFSLIILDLIMPFIGGVELLKAIRERFPTAPVIVMTASNEIDTAVACMKSGALDYLVKPVEVNRFLATVEKAFELQRLENEVDSLKKSLLSGGLTHPDAFSEIRTCHRNMTSIFKYAEAIARSPQPVLITGETGVGKELLARALYTCSGMKGPFVAVNIAGLDDAMFSDTLFGHRRGAFTGADGAREGLIGRASGGALFLDEIGDLDGASQVKLLRLIQEREYYPLGADIPQKTDARLIVSTNRNLHSAMERGTFRKDLFYRLNAHHIHLPPLRERTDDIPLLTTHFLEKASSALKKPLPTASPELLARFSRYPFPGNIREMEAILFDAVSRCGGERVTPEHIRLDSEGWNSPEIPEKKRDLHSTERPDAEEEAEPLTIMMERVFGHFPTFKQMEQYLVDQALKRSCGNQGAAASLLGVSRQALNKRLSRGKEESS